MMTTPLVVISGFLARLFAHPDSGPAFACSLVDKDHSSLLKSIDDRIDRVCPYPNAFAGCCLHVANSVDTDLRRVGKLLLPHAYE